MPAKKKNVSEVSKSLPSAKNYKFAIIISDWNSEITHALFKGAYDFLIENAAKKSNIEVLHVPGSFELCVGAEWMARKNKFDAVICLGCVIQGETRHFEFICQAVANGLTQIGIKHAVPVIFGVLTTNNMEQALARSGGKHGNKGIEAAATALLMAANKKSIQ